MTKAKVRKLGACFEKCAFQPSTNPLIDRKLVSSCPLRSIKLEATHYDVLQVPHTASREEIRKSYRRLILLHHPDRQSTSLDAPTPSEAQAYLNNGAPSAETLNLAYEVLYNAAQRQRYDELLKKREAHRTSSAADAPVSHILSLSDFRTAEDDEDHFYYPSRCGEDFSVSTQELEEGDGELTLYCEGCTERIRVVYQEEEEEEGTVDQEGGARSTAGSS